MPEEQLTDAVERDAPATEPTHTEPESHLEDAGKRALQAERERAKSAEREAAALKAEIEKRDKDAAAAKAKDAEAQGRWEELAKQRETALATIEGERDALANEADALRTYFDAQYTAALKDLPEVVTAFKPSDDASFAEKSAWLTKAQEQAAKVAKSQAPGNHPNPKSADGKFDLQAEIAKARASGRYRA